ncbi:MAG: hypothetical protein IKA02_01910 [Clostridia bacterium]|nr:hypothetical protein [Clostridia bacterium]
MRGLDIAVLISGIIFVISFALFVSYLIIYRILERSTGKTEITIGHYEKIKNVTGGKKIHTSTVNGWTITNYAIYKYEVNGKTYYQKWDATRCQKAPKQKIVTYIKKFPCISKVENYNRYQERYIISAATSLCSLAVTLLPVFL